LGSFLAGHDMVKENSFLLKTPDNVSLFVAKLEHSFSNGSPQEHGALLILHGIGEHSGRYHHIPSFLSQDFDTFYTMDLRGHGRSAGLRGHTPSFDSFVEDLRLVVQEIKKREPQKKLYLLAHSFGGLISLRMILTDVKVLFEAVIISAPLLGVAVHVPWYKFLAAEILNYTLSALQLTNEINPSFLSHDPQVVEAYVKDRLVHRKMTPRLYFEMCKTIDWIFTQSGPFSCPVLFLVPGQDKIVSSAKTLEFYQNIKSQDKKLIEYPEMYHEILNEIGKEKVFEEIHAWLKTLKIKTVQHSKEAHIG